MRTTRLFDFDNTYGAALPELGVEWKAAPASEPSLLVANDALAEELGVPTVVLRSPEAVGALAGTISIDGAEPIAMAYAGHQFGGYSPQLGDGRALLLGEVVDVRGRRRDIHLKGSGRTPFARGGDGKAAVGPMLREFVVAEAMHALGIPTARALAVVATGDPVLREGVLPGAVLTRIASSHLRIGTFEYAARVGEPELVRRLADYAIQRHYPHVVESEQPYLAFFEAVAEAQASLIARWMGVGFIHGVMNTDNMTISGETIDYGPCAFMDRYDPATVFSSIDHGSRYAFRNQPGIAQWNLARLAETLLPLIDDDIDRATEQATAALSQFTERFAQQWTEVMGLKIGIPDVGADDAPLIDDLLALLQTGRVDFTSSFRALATSLRAEATGNGRGAVDVGLATFGDLEALAEWVERWRARLSVTTSAPDLSVVADAMDAVNPIYIPRNHLVEAALDAATSGDLGPFEQLLERVTHPFVVQADSQRFAEPAPDDFNERFRTFCGT